MTQEAPTDFNPWLEIWYRPRATIRRIVQTDPKRNVYLLAALAGFAQFLDRAGDQALGDNMGVVAILAMGLAVGSIGGVVSLAISTFVIGFVARRLGGDAESEDTMAALAWSQAPVIFSLVIIGLQILIYGGELFSSVSPRIEANPVLALLIIPFAAAGILLALWQFVLTVLTLAEVNRFSIWRSLATLFIAALVAVVPFVACILLLG